MADLHTKNFTGLPRGITRLKTLEIQGFKSFPDKIKLNFNDGLTAVVGPNGSGKSNISDAIRWVLGEQGVKSLRGSKMEDVIFDGTQARKQQGFAQVSLTVDNSDNLLDMDSDEITITRKYYRSGESEYRINGASVRLKDVNELFMDTGLGKDGYSMIGQGKIAEIVDAKSSERRQIFEEAAGISKFRYRKIESERRLKGAEENLLRLRDILTEVETRVVPLKEQSEKAKKFLELSGERKTLEISLWVSTLENSTENLRKHEDKLVIIKNEYDEIETEIENLDAKTTDVYAEMQDCLVKMDELRKEKEDAETLSAQLVSDIAVLNNDIQHNNANIDRITDDIGSVKTSSMALADEIEIKKQMVADAEKRIQATEKDILKKQDEILNLAKQSDEFAGKVAELTNSLNRLTLEQTEQKMMLLSAKDIEQELTQRIEVASKAKSVQQENLDISQAELTEIESGIENIKDQNTQLDNSLTGYAMKLQSRAKKLDEVQAECDGIDKKINEKLSRAKLLSDLEQNMEGFAYSVKTVIKASKSGELRGVIGTVSQIMNVDSKYTIAIETALGGSLQNVVVENEATAKSVINLLSRQKGGRATFLPITSIKGNILAERGLDSVDGFEALASEVVTADSKFAGIINSLLGRIVLVDDLDTATIMAKKYGYKFKIVTLDGQVVNAGGSFTGGSQNKNQGILSRKNDIKKLKNEAIALEKKKNELALSLQSVKAEVDSLDAQIVAINSEKTVLSEDRIRFEGEVKRLQHIVEETTTAIQRADEEIKQVTTRKVAGKETFSNTTERLKELEKEILANQTELLELQGSKDGLSDNRDRLAQELSEFKMQNSQAQKEVEITNQTITEISGRTQNTEAQVALFEQNKKDLADKNVQIETEIAELSEQIEGHINKSESSEKEIANLADIRNKLDTSTSGIRQEQSKKTAERENLSRELARLEERKINMQKDVDAVIDNMWEEYQLTLSEASLLTVKVENLQKAQKELNAIKSKIKGLGSVNVAAIDEYTECAERYEFLSKQINDVETSRNELMKIIGELTSQMQEIFEENFKLINKYFSQIFVDLFGGGKAELTLTDDQNLLECGIDIFVQPPGKIIKNLSSLSGGEQAFVAIAIYFAILKVRPAPFCVLDEIEAALDEANVTKYARYLRQLTDKTQFILITHRRGSMEEADVLYGITMQEKGVSKLLELHISDALKVLEQQAESVRE